MTAVLAVLLAPAAWPWALAVSAAVGAALAWWPVRPSRSRVVRSVLLVPVALGVLLPALIGLVASANSVITVLARPGGPWFLVDQLVLSTVVLLAVLVALRWPARWPDGAFVVLAIIGGLVLKAGFTAMVAVEPVSDFAGQWRLAGQVSDQGLETVTSSRSYLTRIHFERIALYFLPLRMLFGPSRWSYAVSNVAVTVLCSWLAYLLARRFLDRAGARVALVLSLLAVEPLLAAGIPSHDVPGTLFILVAILLFLAVDRRAARGDRLATVTALSVSLGVVLTLVELQRTNRLFLLIAFAVILGAELWQSRPVASRPAVEARRWAKRLILGLLLPGTLAVAGDAVLRQAGLSMPREVRAVRKYLGVAGHSDSWSSGNFAYASKNYYQRYADLPADHWRDLAVRKLLTDVYRNPVERTANYLRKGYELWTLGDQLSFYLHKARLPRGRPLGGDGRLRLITLSRSFGVLFLGLVMCGVLKLFATPRASSAAFLPVLYLSLLSGALLLVFQPQSRYLFPIWYLGALYAGLALGGTPEEPSESVAGAGP